MKGSIKIFFPISLLLTPVLMFAQNAPAVANIAQGSGDHLNMTVLRIVLLTLAVLLMIVIILLAKAVQYSSVGFFDKLNQRNSTRISALILFSLLGSSVMAQAPASSGELSVGMPMDIFFILILIFLEVIAIGIMSLAIFRFNKNERLKRDVNWGERFMKLSPFLVKFNKKKVALSDEELDLNHDYDGISELDNRIPGWWSFAFYASILFGVVYLYRMFISGGIPNQFTELEAANAIAAINKTEFLAASGGNVDETTVKLVDAAGIKSGQDLFVKNCAPCHGKEGGGNAVGPNLTDDYWLHKGGIKDIFATIKYGVPEKGMKSWKDDFSPVQIAELASFIKSIHGTTPPDPKAPQGEIYKEDAPVN